jgi:DNA-binding transcriptional ArsR family regulator
MLEPGGPPVKDFIGESKLKRRLLARLVSRPMTPTELAALESKHVSHISRALKELRVRGVVEPMRSDSRETYYRMTVWGIRAYAALSRIG